MKTRPELRGFTLLEVMIALAIFVAAALALDSAMGANTRGTIRFEEKTLATWVAANKLVELQLYQQWPTPGRQDDEAEFAGRKWLLQVDVSNGPLADTRRVDINVGPALEMGAERHFTAMLTALLVKPVTPAVAPPAAPAGEVPGASEPPAETPSSPDVVPAPEGDAPPPAPSAPEEAT